MTKINQNSNYWTGNLTGSLDMWWREDIEEAKKGRDVVALASYRSAIANYVNIVTGRTDIPVTYNSADESYTDGKKVYLSGNMNEKNFDPNVGLALHEGSHIVHSDFDLIKSLYTTVIKRYNLNTDNFDGQHEASETTEKIKNLLNYVEDRRIDYIVFKSAPGYKNYYHAMYDKYFNFSVINKALKSGTHRELDWDSYMFRIMNFTNSNTDLDALPGLREIYRTINFKNISRLKNTEDALEVAFKIYDIIVANIPDAVDQPEEPNNSEGEGESGEGEGSEAISGGSSDESGDNLEQMEGSSDNESGEGTVVDLPELTPGQERSLKNAIKKQEELQNGKSKKVKLTKAEKASVKSVEDSGAYQVEVGTSSREKTQVVVYPRITDSMVEASNDWSKRELYPFMRTNSYYTEDTTEAVNRGLLLGKILGKKLKVRNEERVTKWSRQESGRLDKRIIAELGFNNDRVFKTQFVEKYNDAFIHISIDGSGSMNGKNFDNAIKSTAAICQAAAMAGNIHVQVTLRTTISNKNWYKPLMVVLYDSKVNKIVHIKKYWQYLTTSGTTPEGLCFEAISKQIMSDSAGRDAFFLNYSDGMPYYSANDFYYSGPTAVKHTKREIEKIRNAGIEVLSFYVTEPGSWNRESAMVDFKKMYGKDATTIDPTKMVALAKELNKKFLQKS
tara:strand:+ start:2841 stop:4862 length:2022 start_codon:yes stop_codon:yes gene_type:complete